MKRHRISSLVGPRTRVAGAVAATLAWCAVYAQEQPAASQQIQEVTVTGSRIQGITNANSPSPISVTTAEDILKTGATNIEDVLSRMIGPDFGNGGVSSASNNGGIGLSVVGLRNLGPPRTLILIDGQRLIGTYSGTTEVVDLSAVPLAMVDRIEVLRDGASSIYGADAIGGVINIITKKHAEGATFDASYGQTGHTDDQTKNLMGSIGVNSDRGNLLVAASWDHEDPVQQSARSYAEDPHLGGPAEGGSTYRSQLDTLQDENSNNIWINNTLYSLKNPAAAAFLPNDVYLTGAGKIKLNAGAPGWNYLSQGLDRKQISYSGHYDITPAVTFVSEAFFTDRDSLTSLRPEPLLGDSIATSTFPGFFVPSFAPGYPTGVEGAYGFAAFLTPDQFGPRRYDSDSQTYRIRNGVEGNFTIADHKYNWEAGYIDQHNSTTFVTKNEGNFEHLAQLTGLVNCVDVPGGCTTLATPIHTSNYDPVTNPVTTMITSIPTVQPNWFGGPSGIFTPAQVAYLTWNNTDRRTSTERVTYGDVNGDVFALPAGEIRAAIGAEHRDEFLADNPDILVQEGWGPNQSLPTAGGYNVSSVYAELNVPILKDLPGVESLTSDLSGRRDHYSTFGNATTYKFGVEYTPIEDVRLRGSISTGFRAPNVAELFGGTAISDLTASGDPCDTRAAGYNGNANVGTGILTAGSTCAKAVNNGNAVTNFQSGNNSQTDEQQQVEVGGNPGLSPEKSNNWGLGLVLTPRMAQGLSLAVDYYNIRISNTVLTSGIVGATSVDTVLEGCYGPQQNEAYCSLIQRNAQGTIIQINSLAANFGIARVTGIDYQLTYDTSALTLPIPGNFKFDLQVSEQFTNTQTNADGSISSYTGAFQYSNESIEPKFKGLMAIDYGLGGFTLHYDARYLERVTNFDGSAPTYGNEIPAYVYHNLSGSYKLKNVKYVKEATIVIGVDNVADKDPPFVNGDSICKCNSLAGPYDMVGRFFYARLSTKF